MFVQVEPPAVLLCHCSWQSGRKFVNTAFRLIFPPTQTLLDPALLIETEGQGTKPKSNVWLTYPFAPKGMVIVSIAYPSNDFPSADINASLSFWSSAFVALLI